jgi:hypothetical protein
MIWTDAKEFNFLKGDFYMEKKVYEINGKKVTNMFELFEAMESTRNNKTLEETGEGLIIKDADEDKKEEK